MKYIILPAIFTLIMNSAFGQHYKYIDSSKVMGPAKYAAGVQRNPETRLVEIKKYIPGIALDIRYATTNNFTHHRMYPQARAFARLPVVLALKDVQDELKAKAKELNYL